MAQGAGENIKGIIGSTGWNWSLQDAGSQAFTKSFGQEYGFHHHRLHTHATVRRFFMRMQLSALEHLILFRSSRPLRIMNLTEWATDDSFTVAQITKCSRTYLLYVVTRTHQVSLTCCRSLTLSIVTKSPTHLICMQAIWDHTRFKVEHRLKTGKGSLFLLSKLLQRESKWTLFFCKY